MMLLQQSFSLITTRVSDKIMQNGGTVPEGSSFQVHPSAPIVTYCAGTVGTLQLVRYAALTRCSDPLQRREVPVVRHLCQGKTEGTKVPSFITDSSR